ncbi:hypothetical protein LTR49_025776 [Elasticomyces elasticus]|nr:hypothetical protein LTR49_025776 [Elasticomyces elasticus]
MSTTLDHAGFGTPTMDDPRPWLWVVSIVSCSYSVLTLAARFMAKLELLGAEDALISSAYVLSVAHWSLLDRATYIGMGTKDPDLGRLRYEAKLFFWSQVVLFVTLYLIKISVLWFARRVFSGTNFWNTKVFDIATGFTACCGIASIAVFSIGCTFNSAFGPYPGHCSKYQARWAIIQVLDAGTEAIIVGLPSYFVFQNTIKMSSKITIVTLFGLRLPCVAFMAATVHSYKTVQYGVASRMVSVVPVAVWSEVLLGYALSSASFPCIRAFLTAFLADGVHRIHESTLGGSCHHATGNSTSIQGNTQRGAPCTSVDAKGEAELAGETGSVASDASQRMMIERSMEIEMTIISTMSSSASMVRQEPNPQPQFPYYGGH